MNAQNENAPSATWANMVPPELNDVLREQTPGRDNANFRLDVRKAWVAVDRGECQRVECRTQNAWQVRVLDMVNALRGIA